jgi:hypothetical protein
VDLPQRVFIHWYHRPLGRRWFPAAINFGLYQVRFQLIHHFHEADASHTEQPSLTLGLTLQRASLNVSMSLEYSKRCASCPQQVYSFMKNLVFTDPRDYNGQCFKQHNTSGRAPRAY